MAERDGMQRNGWRRLEKNTMVRATMRILTRELSFGTVFGWQVRSKPKWSEKDECVEGASRSRAYLDVAACSLQPPCGS